MPPRCQDHQHNASASPQLACRALPLRSRFAAAAALARSQASVHPTEASAPEPEPGPWLHGRWVMAHGSCCEGAASVPEKQTASKKLAVAGRDGCVWDADQTPGLWEWLSDLESGM